MQISSPKKKSKVIPTCARKIYNQECAQKFGAQLTVILEQENVMHKRKQNGLVMY